MSNPTRLPLLTNRSMPPSACSALIVLAKASVPLTATMSGRDAVAAKTRPISVAPTIPTAPARPAFTKLRRSIVADPFRVVLPGNARNYCADTEVIGGFRVSDSEVDGPKSASCEDSIDAKEWQLRWVGVPKTASSLGERIVEVTQVIVCNATQGGQVEIPSDDDGTAPGPCSCCHRFDLAA